METPIISCCGTVCSECPAWPDSCDGCFAVHGTPYWTAEAGLERCPLYACCRRERELPHCGLCKELPCEMFRSLKDPAMSDEEHEKGLSERIARLKRRSQE